MLQYKLNSKYYISHLTWEIFKFLNYKIWELYYTLNSFPTLIFYHIGFHKVEHVVIFTVSICLLKHFTPVYQSDTINHGFCPLANFKILIKEIHVVHVPLCSKWFIFSRYFIVLESPNWPPHILKKMYLHKEHIFHLSIAYNSRRK